MLPFHSVLQWMKVVGLHSDSRETSLLIFGEPRLYQSIFIRSRRVDLLI